MNVFIFFGLKVCQRTSSRFLRAESPSLMWFPTELDLKNESEIPIFEITRKNNNNRSNTHAAANYSAGSSRLLLHHGNKKNLLFFSFSKKKSIMVSFFFPFQTCKRASLNRGWISFQTAATSIFSRLGSNNGRGMALFIGNWWSLITSWLKLQPRHDLVDKSRGIIRAAISFCDPANQFQPESFVFRFRTWRNWFAD